MHCFSFIFLKVQYPYPLSWNKYNNKFDNTNNPDIKQGIYRKKMLGKTQFGRKGKFISPLLGRKDEKPGCESEIKIREKDYSYS